MRSLDLDEDGVSIESAVIGDDWLQPVRSYVDNVVANSAGGRRYAMPSQFKPLVDSSGALGALARRLSGRQMQPVRFICFDKSPGNNWGLPWHQDRLIAVKHKLDVQGFGPWSVKHGIPHVEPPCEILTDMLTLRLHLDDCGHENGPLEVVRGSCHVGRMEASRIRDYVKKSQVYTCLAKAGDVVVMRGFTIHASRPAVEPKHRRVLHVDFSSMNLPAGLEWAV